MRTDEKLGEICERLQYNCGDLHEAARYCGVSPHFLVTWIKEDKEADEQVQEARRVGYAGLESVAIKRAVQGVEEDIYYQGAVVGQKTVYSDGLLSKVMEARLPEYKKGESGGNTFNGPTQINLMPRAASYEEWLGMRDATLARRDADGNQPSLPAPVEAEFVEVNRPLAALGGLL